MVCIGPAKFLWLCSTLGWLWSAHSRISWCSGHAIPHCFLEKKMRLNAFAHELFQNSTVWSLILIIIRYWLHHIVRDTDIGLQPLAQSSQVHHSLCFDFGVWLLSGFVHLLLQLQLQFNFIDYCMSYNEKGNCGNPSRLDLSQVAFSLSQFRFSSLASDCLTCCVFLKALIVTAIITQLLQIPLPPSCSCHYLEVILTLFFQVSNEQKTYFHRLGTNNV